MSKHILCIAVILSLSACQSETAAPLSAQDVPTTQPQLTNEPEPTVTPSPSPSPSASPATITLEVRSYSETRYPQHLWPTKGYTATASCATYLSETYCWDDGMKNPNIPGSPNLRYTFWNIDGSGAPVGGVMTVDGMATPRIISNALEANIASALGITGKVQTVLLFGAPSMVSCVDDHGTLDCGTFSIDTLQVAF